MAVPKVPNDIFQYATTSGLQAGYSSHGPIVKDLGNYGTHGIGIAAKSDNKLLFIDSQAYEIDVGKQKVQGQHNLVHKPSPETGVSFVMVAKFVPEHQTYVHGEMEKEALLEIFAQNGPDAGGKNSFILFRIRGEFKRIRFEAATRAHCQPSLHKTEDLVKLEGGELKDINGVIFGIYGPDSFSGISLTGTHCCFLSNPDEDGKRYGGAYVDFETKGDAELSWALPVRFHMGFPQGREWAELEMPKKATPE